MASQLWLQAKQISIAGWAHVMGWVTMETAAAAWWEDGSCLRLPCPILSLGFALWGSAWLGWGRVTSAEGWAGSGMFSQPAVSSQSPCGSRGMQGWGRVCVQVVTGPCVLLHLRASSCLCQERDHLVWPWRELLVKMSLTGKHWLRETWILFSVKMLVSLALWVKQVFHTRKQGRRSPLQNEHPMKGQSFRLSSAAPSGKWIWQTWLNSQLCPCCCCSCSREEPEASSRGARGAGPKPLFAQARLPLVPGITGAVSVLLSEPS